MEYSIYPFPMCILSSENFQKLLIGNESMTLTIMTDKVTKSMQGSTLTLARWIGTTKLLVGTTKLLVRTSNKDFFCDQWLIIRRFLPERFLGVKADGEEELGDELGTQHSQLFRLRLLKQERYSFIWPFLFGDFKVTIVFIINIYIIKNFINEKNNVTVL